MKNILKPLLFIVALCISSCINKNSTTYEPPIFEAECAVKVEILNSDSTLIIPAQPIIFDSLLLFIDYGSKNKLQVFNRITGKFVKSFLQKGNAYEEVAGDYLSLSLDSVNGLLYVFDHNKNRIFSLDLNNILRDDLVSINKSFTLSSTLKNSNDIKFVKDSLFMAIGRGYKNNNRLIFSSPTVDKYIYTAVTYDSKIFENANQWVKFMSDTNFEITPDGNKLITSTRSIGGILEIYDISDTIELKCVKNFYEPIFGKHFTPTIESTTVFKDICVTNEYIYSTVWVKPALDLVKFPNIIWKFSLAGDPIASYICDYPIEDFAVDEKSQMAYAFVHKEDGNIEIAKIDLNIK